MNMTVELKKLMDGNKRYLEAKQNSGDISLSIRKETTDNGQHPFAIVITCADSRVVPEHMFMCGLGEIFVIRVAGNVLTDTQIASVLYGMEHLKAKLIVVLGHTHCGAIGATIEGGVSGVIKSLTDEIKSAIGKEKDDYKACALNVKKGLAKLINHPEINKVANHMGSSIIGAIYNIDTGIVDFNI